VGLTDAPYLCRLFKRYFRMSPQQYRQQEFPGKICIPLISP
jgi:AraC-like DNA-binding protein